MREREGRNLLLPPMRGNAGFVGAFPWNARERDGLCV